jgi:hypothetical protein
MAIQEADKLWWISSEPLEAGLRVELGVPDVSIWNLIGWSSISLDNHPPDWPVLGQVLW